MLPRPIVFRLNAKERVSACSRSRSVATMSDAYAPIPCALYSEYELTILRRRRLRLRWREDNVIHARVVLPLDLETRHHQEFLLGRTEHGEHLRIRLDRIVAMELA